METRSKHVIALNTYAVVDTILEEEHQLPEHYEKYEYLGAKDLQVWSVIGGQPKHFKEYCYIPR